MAMPRAGGPRQAWAIAVKVALPGERHDFPSRLTVQNAACRRGGRLLFEGLSFALRSGEALFLTGPNGCGKSSLLRVLAGLTPLETGTVEWDGVTIAQDAAAHRARLHFAGHHDAVKPLLNPGEMLEFWGALRGGVNMNMRAQVELALRTLGLGRQALTPGRLLSAGQKKRVALARLIVESSPLWLLDEPTNGLDSAGVELLEDCISTHRTRGGIVVVATHAQIVAKGATELSPAHYAVHPRKAAVAW